MVGPVNEFTMVLYFFTNHRVAMNLMVVSKIISYNVHYSF